MDVSPWPFIGAAYGTPSETTDGRLEGARPNSEMIVAAWLGAALEVGHILGLLVDPVLGLGELLLLLALALLATSLGPQRRIASSRRRLPSSYVP